MIVTCIIIKHRRILPHIITDLFKDKAIILIMLSYTHIYANRYFWKTNQQQGIEDINGELYAYEFEWNPLKKVRFSNTFMNAYPVARTMAVNRDNYLDFLNNDPSRTGA